jgi:hypothetical protein
MIPNWAGLPAMALPFPWGWGLFPRRTLHVVGDTPHVAEGIRPGISGAGDARGTGVDRQVAFPQEYPRAVWMAAFFGRGWPFWDHVS